LKNNLTINTSGTITVSGTVNYNTGTLTYTAGTVTTTSSTLSIGAATTLNTNGITWNNVTMNAGVTYTLSSNMTVGGTLAVGSNNVTTTINGNTIYVGGDLTINNHSGTVVTGTTTIVLNGTGTWSAGANVGVLKNPLTINTSGTITVSGSVAYNTGTLTYTTGTVTTTGSTLVIGGSVTLPTGITWNNITITAAGTYTLTGNLTMVGNFTVGVGGSINVIINSYTLNVGGNLSMNVNSSGSISGTTVINLNGTGTWTGSGGILSNSLTINTSGTITVSGSVYYNTGTLTYTAGTVTTTSSTLVIGGSVTLPTGITWNNITINASATVTLAGNITMNGTLTAGVGGSQGITINGNTLNVGGSFSIALNGSGWMTGTTTINLNGTGTLSATSTGIFYNPLTINTAGTITISGTIYHATGTITYTAGTVVTTGSTLNIDTTTTLNTNGMSWNNVKFTNSGTYTLSSDLTVNGNFLLGTSAAAMTINGSTIYVAGNLTESLTAGWYVQGTTTIVLNGTGTWSSSGGDLKTPLTINTAGTITVSGTVLYNTGTLTYTAGTVTTTGSTLSISASTTLATAGITWNNVTISSGTTILNSNLAVNGTLSQSTSSITGAGGLILGTSSTWSGSGTTSLGGSLTLGSSMTLSYTGAITFTSTSGTKTITSNGKTLASNLTFNGVGGTWTLADNLTTGATNTITITNGTLDPTTSNYTISTGIWSNSGTFTPRQGTLTLTGTGTLSDTTSFYNLTINGSGKTVTLGAALTTTNNLTITAGTLDASAAGCASASCNISVGGTWSRSGTFTPRTGTLTLTGTSTLSDTTSFYNLTINGSGQTTTLGAALTTTNNLTITAGTLDVSASGCSSASCNITVAKNFSNSGTFTPRTGTVTLNGTSQKVFGSTTFYNFTKDISSASADTLMFENTKTQTGTTGGTFTLKGASGKVLTLRSMNSSGTQSDGTTWLLTINGSQLITYVDVKDSDASGGSAIAQTNSTNSGNLTNWIFDTTPPTAALTYSPNRAVKAGDSLVITATFSEAMADSPVVKLAISGSNTLAATAMTKSSTTVYTYTHTVGTGDGTATVAMSVGTDVAGNVVTSTPTSGSTFTVDNTAPTTTDDYTSKDGTWQTASQVITLTPTDSGGGVSTTKYCQDTTNTCTVSSGTTYTTAVTVSTEGVSYFRYQSTDTAGNVQTTVSRTIKLDTVVPTVDAGFDQTRSSSFTPQATASDATSGIANYSWSKISGPGSITFGDATALSTTVQADTNGSYVVRLAVTDTAGNQGLAEISLIWQGASTTSGGGGGGSLPPAGASEGSVPSQTQDVPAPSFVQQVTQTISTIATTLTGGEPLLPPSSISQTTPDAFLGWDLLTTLPPGALQVSPIEGALPDIAFFAKKFSQFDQVLEATDVAKTNEGSQKINQNPLTLPGLTETALASALASGGTFASQSSVPLDQLSSQALARVPSDIVFAKTGNGYIDYKTNLTFTKEGKANQQIETIVNKPIQLIIKPEHSARKITGLVLLTRKTLSDTTQPSTNQGNWLTRLFSGALSPAITPNITAASTTKEGAQALLLEQFDYQPSANGFWTASLKAPTVDGQYDIVTVLQYQDSKLTPKQITLTTVVDPEGYIYEKINGKEARINEATVSLYSKDQATQQFVLWTADKFLQQNPQTTDTTGKYSFLTPEGTYYLAVQAPGYKTYASEPFTIEKGSTGVFMNIQMHSDRWWPEWMGWQAGMFFLLFVVIVLLLYNVYVNRKKSLL
jgi:hypothetical protein